jgi:hypothetical protein
MLRGKTTGLMICALTLVAAIMPGYAGETSVKAWAVGRARGDFTRPLKTWRSFLATSRALWKWRISKGS